MLPPPGYRDVELVGGGATSRVFRAICLTNDQPVALKRLHRHLLRGDAVARLRREYEALARLRHPGIVVVRDILRWEGDPTVVMEFVAGRDLREVVANDGPLDPEKLQSVARTLFEALAVAHAEGIVHRDVKPQNVRLADDGRILLLDFGSARFSAHSELTAQGTSVGTPDYMAPELFEGPAYDPRVDIYGVGATLFEAATGAPPQEAQSLTELAYQRTHQPAPLVQSKNPAVPDGLAQVIDRCLQRVPEDRYASASLALWALEHPQVAQRFLLRKKQRPPCLHCGTRISPQSGRCPACGSDHPFAFAPGSAHVVLHGAKSQPALLAALLERFPERAQAEHLHALGERCADLAHAPQRLVSFIERAEAERLADQLTTAGVTTEIEHDTGTAGWRFYAAVLAVFVVGFVALGSFLGLPVGLAEGLVLALPPALGLLGERLGAWLAAERGMLAASRLPQPLLPRLTAGLAAASAFFLVAGTLTPLITPFLSRWFELTGLQGACWLAAGVLAGSAVSLAGLGYERARLPAQAAPEPSPWIKLKRAFMLPQRLFGRLQAGLGVALTALVLGLVPAEISALQWLQQQILTPQIIVAPVPAAASAFVEGQLTEIDAPMVAPQAPSAAPAVATVVSAAAPPVVWGLLPLGIGLGASVLALGAVVLGHARRRRLRLAALELGFQIRSASEKALDPPHSRQATALDRGDILAQLPAPDAFTRAARQRVAELVRWLPDESASALEAAYLSLGEGDPRERSLLARAVRETDPEQALRFQFLALEGELEAIAAQRWLDRLDAQEEPRD